MGADRKIDLPPKLIVYSPQKEKYVKKIAAREWFILSSRLDLTIPLKRAARPKIN